MADDTLPPLPKGASFDAPNSDTPPLPKGASFDAPKAETSTLKSMQSPVSDVLYRGLVAPTLGGLADIGSGIFSSGKISPADEKIVAQLQKMGIRKDDPEVAKYIKELKGQKLPEVVGGSEQIQRGMQESELVSPKRRPGIELAVGLTPLGISAVPAALKAGKGAMDYYKLSKGGEAESLSSALKTKLGGALDDVIGKTKEAAKPFTEALTKIGKAEEQLGGRGRVAGARQTAREKEVNDSLDKISSRKNILAEDVGGVIQPAGKENIDKLKATRSQESIDKIKDPAFEQARLRESKGEYLSTSPSSQKEFNSVVDEIRGQIAATPEPYASELKKRFASVMGKEVPMTEGEIRAAQLRASIEGKPIESVGTVKREPMTLDQAEFLRRMLNNKKAFEVEGFPALDTVRQNQLGERLTAAMNAYDPRVGQYLQTYKDLSTPVSKAASGRGGALTEAELLAEEQVLFSADKKATADYFLNGSQERAERLLELVGGKKQEVLDKIRGYYRNRLDNMSSVQAEEFVRSQEGFLRTFPELRDPMTAVVKNKKTLETAAPAAEKSASQAQSRLAGRGKQTQAELSKRQESIDKYDKLQNQLNATAPANSYEKSKSIVNSLRDDKFIDSGTHQRLLNEIEKVKTTYGDTAKAKQTIDALVRKSLLYGGFGLGGATGASLYYGYKAQ